MFDLCSISVHCIFIGAVNKDILDFPPVSEILTKGKTKSIKNVKSCEKPRCFFLKLELSPRNVLIFKRLHFFFAPEKLYVKRGDPPPLLPLSKIWSPSSRGRLKNQWFSISFRPRNPYFQKKNLVEPQDIRFAVRSTTTKVSTLPTINSLSRFFDLIS